MILITQVHDQNIPKGASMKNSVIALLFLSCLTHNFLLADIRPFPKKPKQPPKLGVQLLPFDIGNKKGLLVTAVFKGFPAAQLRENGKLTSLEGGRDLILEINGVPVSSIEDYDRQMKLTGNNINIKVLDIKTGKTSEYQGRFD